jgi:two-component system response regulator AtoC
MSQLATLPPPAEASFELIVRTSEAARAVTLEVGQVASVGRDEENLIRVDSASVSRQHLQLHAQADFVEVEDLGSSNGTLLIRGIGASGEREADGRPREERLVPYQRRPLRVGDALQVGPALLSLQHKRRSSRVAGNSCRAVSVGGPPILIDPALKSAYELVTRAAATEISVLILGETGAGKEAMAQTVHLRSPRCTGPFLLLNCAALSETLLESELFGHEKGAFTGANTSKAGLLEATAGGTVFLDEVGELPLGTQAKLLRVLEERLVLRVGATKPRRIDVRFVTATNRDLSREVRAGRFRGDLYYRISGLVLRIPPLRERLSEIEPLARHFIEAFTRQLGQTAPSLKPAAVAALQAYAWPGNVRELKNIVERAVLLAGNASIEREHVLPEPVLDGDDADSRSDFDDEMTEESTRLIRRRKLSALPPSGVMAARPDAERERFIQALEICGGNQTRAAQLLGVSRRTLINRLDRWKLPRPQKR